MHLRDITIAYGMTETSPVSFPDDARRRRSSAACPPSARIHPHLEAKIDRRRGPHRAARHARRTVHARLFGDARLLGRRRAHGRSDRRAGWMHTGDLATIDAEGYCAIVGRIKDMVIRGGENVYPREVEEFLYRHPKIIGRAGVRRAGPEIRRGALRLDQAARRRNHDRGGRARASAATRSPTTRCRAMSASWTSSR